MGVDSEECRQIFRPVERKGKKTFGRLVPGMAEGRKPGVEIVAACSNKPIALGARWALHHGGLK